jgi:hypothetical protein
MRRDHTVKEYVVLMRTSVPLEHNAIFPAFYVKTVFSVYLWHPWTYLSMSGPSDPLGCVEGRVVSREKSNVI